LSLQSLQKPITLAEILDDPNRCDYRTEINKYFDDLITDRYVRTRSPRCGRNVADFMIFDMFG